MKKLFLMLGILSSSALLAGNEDYIPLTLSGYNADLVVGVNESYKNSIDNNKWSFYSSERLEKGGLPSGIVGLHSGVPYQFADFAGNNALHLCTAAKDEEKGTSFGSRQTLTLVEPVQARQIWLLGTAGNGPAGMNITINYSDGTSEETVKAEMPDWSQSSDASTAYWGLGRIGDQDNVDGAYTFSLFERIAKADAEKFVQSVTVEIVDKGSFLSVFALTALDKDAEVTQDKTLYFITNSHLDTQWNWTVRKTIDEYIPKTLRENFARFEDPDDKNYQFNFEGAIKYMWMKEYYPDQYEKVKEYVESGRWNISGGALDANDVNVPSAESVIRNFLLGQKFYLQEFGVRGGNDIMLPDCFGFPWSLPTLGAHCGMTSFHTNKLAWGSAWAFDDLPPFGIWRGVDGSELFCVFKPGAYDNHEIYRKDMTYDGDMFNDIVSNEEKYGLPVAFRYIGVRGDTGGGLDKESTDWLSRSIDSDGPVKVVAKSPTEMFAEVTPRDLSKVETINHGLPMKAHGVGCYTSRTMLKYWNRKTELLAGATEKSSVMADWLGGLDYQSDVINDVWTRLIWHQFHDDLPGTSINDAYIYSCNDYVLGQLDLSRTLDNAVGAVAKNMNTSACTGIPLVVYNPLSINRTDIVEASVAVSGTQQGIVVTDKDGNTVPAQVLKQDGGQLSFIFLATVPSLGYATYNVAFADNATNDATGLSVSETGLENNRYKVALDANGDVSSVLDKQQGNRELLSAPIRLALLFDESLTWPSWEIHGDQLQREPMGYVDEDVKVEVAERGPLRVSLKVTRKKEGSTFVQYIRLASAGASDRIDFVNEVDWQAKERMLKAVFPLTASNPKAAYDLSIGVEENNNSTNYDDRNAMCEFLGHQWADVTNSDGAFGVSILNDCKYGWDKQTDNTIRLTLIHTPKVGNNYTYQGSQDMGLNRFTYSFFGHTGKWGAATQWEAEKLNQPMLAYQTTKHDGSLGQAFGFAQVNTSNVAVKALKKAESSDEIILRVYELTGKESAENVTVTFPGNITSAREVNGVEEPVGPVAFSGNTLSFSIGKFQPKTFAVKLDAAPVSETAAKSPSSVKVDLDYNIDVMSLNDNRTDAETSFAYPGELLSDEVVADGILFKIGDRTEGTKNAVRCEGQTIDLPVGHQAKKLYVLAASTLGTGVDATFKIDGKDTDLHIEYYADYVGIWSNSEYIKTSYKKENTAFTATHRHDAVEGKDESYQYMYMFKYVIPVDADAKTLTLPTDDSVLLFAVTLSDNTNDDTVPVSEVAKLLVNEDTESQYQPIEHGDEKLEPVVIKASGMTGNSEGPQNVADDMPYSKWCDASSPRKWVEFRFDEPKTITQWYVLHAGLEKEGFITGEFYLQRYENGGWIDVDGVVKNSENVTNRVLEVPFVSDRVRLRIVYGQQGNDNSAARICEFAVYGKTATEEDKEKSVIISRVPSEGYGKQLARVHSYSARTKSGEDPYYMLAGGMSNKWCDNTSEQPWAIIELNDIYAIDRFDIWDSQTFESFPNSAEFWISVSTTGTADDDFVEVVHQENVGDQYHKVSVLDEAVDARYVKLQMARTDGAVRVFGFDIWGKLKEKIVRQDVPVSFYKSIVGFHDIMNEREMPFTLLDGIHDRIDFKWCFQRGQADKDPIKWVVIDLEDEYDVNQFVIYDAKVVENEKNMGGYSIWSSTVAPTDEEMDNFKKVSGGDNWTKLVDVVSGGEDIDIKRHVLDTPIRARYIKLEVPCDRIEGTTRLFEFEVYSDENTQAIDEVKTHDIKVYPNPVRRNASVCIEADGNATASLYSLDGLLLRQVTLEGNGEVSTAGLDSGTYFLRVVGNETACEKVLVE